MADLPPTEYLILEVLAARVRLAERMWTFPARLKPALDRLQERGLIWYRSAPTPRDYQAYLTEAGEREALAEEYVPPRDRMSAEIERLRARVAELEPFEPRTGGFSVGEDGSPVVDVRFPESFAQLMLASFRAYLDEHQAPNYVHMPMTDMTTGETYFATIGRPGGKSPHEMRELAEGRLAEVRAYARALAGPRRQPGYGLGRIRDDLLAILDRQEGTEGQ
jgi:DNA-binding MarR family transcriptional regulator